SYGLAKICGIKLCEKIQKQSNKEFFALVPTNIYGVGDHFEETRAHVIGALMTRFHNAKNNNRQNVSVRGSGNALREFIYVDDVADACYFFLTHPTSSPHINIGTSQEISIKDLSCMIKKIVGYTGEIIFDTTKPEGRLKRKLDTSLAKTYGRNASTSLESGIQKTYEYFLSIL
ncbi:MAG TPA: NAD-dependent epimerase/dehydratase family protein, partial [Candidatus Absconditabacterales bacterium]|nr:NAD-dependent epimerase/dehydratase family protein [Candidatus Absconditabacterales bacterium]